MTQKLSNMVTPTVPRFFKKASVLTVEQARGLLNSKTSLEALRDQELQKISEDGENLSNEQIELRIQNIMKQRKRLLPKDLPHDMWIVHLDDKPLLTPKKFPLTVPSKAVALGIAAEWNSSGQKVRPTAMPLMTIAATTLDVTSDRRLFTIDNILKYIHTDTALIRAPTPPPLVAWQSKLLDPIVQKFSRRFSVDLIKSESLHPQDQDESTIERVKAYLESLDNWTLSCLEYVTSTTKSLIISTTLLDCGISVEQALKAMRTEEDFQLSNFRQVEQAHDLDILDAKVKLGSAITFYQLSRQHPLSQTGQTFVPDTRNTDSIDIRAWANARHTRMKTQIAKKYEETFGQSNSSDSPSKQVPTDTTETETETDTPTK